MTERQFKRAYKILEEIDNLKNFKKQDKTITMLRYIQPSLIKEGYAVSIVDKGISKILKKHDKMIRKEIDIQINKLTRQLEKL